MGKVHFSDAAPAEATAAPAAGPQSPMLPAAERCLLCCFSTGARSSRDMLALCDSFGSRSRCLLSDRVGHEELKTNRTVGYLKNGEIVHFDSVPLPTEAL